MSNTEWAVIISSTMVVIASFISYLKHRYDSILIEELLYAAVGEQKEEIAKMIVDLVVENIESKLDYEEIQLQYIAEKIAYDIENGK